MEVLLFAQGNGGLLFELPISLSWRVWFFRDSLKVLGALSVLWV